MHCRHIGNKHVGTEVLRLDILRVDILALRHSVAGWVVVVVCCGRGGGCGSRNLLLYFNIQICVFFLRSAEQTRAGMIFID